MTVIRRFIQRFFPRLIRMEVSSPVNIEDKSDVINDKKRQSTTEPAAGDDIKKPKLDSNATPPPLLGRLDKGRKVALLLAYCGAGYYGIQIQKDFPTIESELLSALVKCKCITQEQADTPNKIHFQRAARTDKGVSALGNIISLKMCINSDDIVDIINKELPKQIRVLSYIRATKSFNSKNFCDSRTYMYMVPTYAFTPVNQPVKDDYRIDDETFTLLNTVLSKYKGTHNFHNYTSGIKPTDASANRFIIKFEADKPTVEDGIEFITLRVTGQSFMLHHIRKMVALTICVVKGLCDMETIQKSWLHDKMDVPRAPSEGLFLYQTHYTGYNRRYGTDGIHDPLDWSHCQSEADEFLNTHIKPYIVKSERDDRIIKLWLDNLKLHTFGTREDHQHNRLNNRQPQLECESTDVNESIHCTETAPCAPPSDSVSSSATVESSATSKEPSLQSTVSSIESTENVISSTPESLQDPVQSLDNKS